MELLGILLQAAKQQQSAIPSIVMMVGIVVVFYFFMIRPQQKKQKDAKKFREGIKKGDAVVTIGGIFGKVLGFEGDAVLVEVDKGTKLKIEKAAISSDSSAKLNEPAKDKAKK